MAQILKNNVRHRHAKSCGKILFGHCLLLGRIHEKANQASGKVFRVAGLVKLDCHALPVRHLAKILKIGAHDRDAVGTSQVSDSAGSRRRGVGHDSDGGTLKKIGQLFLVNIAGKFNSRISRVLFLHPLHVASGVRMVPSCNH
jgi:hypothetical protein